MARLVNVTSIAYPNNPNDIVKGMKRVQEIWELLIDRAALNSPDIILLPEHFMHTGMGKCTDLAEPTDSGPVSRFLSRKAAQYNCYIFGNYLTLRKGIRGGMYNSAVLFDRRGKVVGIYDKVFPTIGEMEKGILPGLDGPKVFDTDFARVASGICFDLNFRKLFTEYRDSRVVHIDGNIEKMLALKQKYRDRIREEVASQEAVYLSCFHPRKSVDDLWPGSSRLNRARTTSTGRGAFANST